jgi:hypothetical protein
VRKTLDKQCQTLYIIYIRQGGNKMDKIKKEYDSAIDTYMKNKNVKNMYHIIDLYNKMILKAEQINKNNPIIK